MCVCVCLFDLYRWNVVGIQGSLMSYFTEPIYFSSIILGSLYHADHLSRAMYQRIADIEDLPQQFTLNRPLLSGQCLLWCEANGEIRGKPIKFLLKFQLNKSSGWSNSMVMFTSSCWGAGLLIFLNQTPNVWISKEKMLILTSWLNWSVQGRKAVIAFLLCLIWTNIYLVPEEFK